MKWPLTFFALLLAASAYASPLQPVALKCEYSTNPLGIDVAVPRLAWNFSSTERNQRQSAYEIIVSDKLALINQQKGDQWNSGKQSSDQNIQVAYAGAPLRPLTRYYWRVRVYNQAGEASNWSEVNWFETAMLSTAWKAKWINDGKPQPAKDEDYYKPDGMPLLRTVFTTARKPVAARLYIAGLGYYEAYLNGQKIGNSVLDPGFTAYRKQILYAVHDITTMVKKGNNVIGIMLGSGWWNPLPFKFFGRWDFRDYQQTGRPCVKAELHIRYDDASEEVIATDESWKGTSGPVIQNNVYIGEHYDARLEPQHWNSATTPGGVWSNAVVANGPEGILMAQLQPPIRVTKTVRPVKIIAYKPGVFIADMGQNFAGVASIRVKGKAGTSIVLRYGEDLFPDGSLNVMTTAATQIKKGGIKGGPGAPETMWQEDRYILKGEGVESWHPRFTFHGFRYVEITGWPGQPSVDDIEGLRMNTDLQQNGSFACSDSAFNRLHDVVQWTFLSNVFSVQSDCPGREKMGYGADIAVTANAYMYNYNMAGFYTKTVTDFANDQQPDGGITEIAPFTGIADRGYGGASGPLGWQLAFPYVQELLYNMYGDKRIIENNYEAIKKQLDFLQSKARDNIFYWDISDHEALDPKPEALSATAFYYQHASIAAGFAGILGKTADSVRFAQLAQRIKQAIISKFFLPGTGRFDNGTQSAQLFALWYGFSPEKENSMKALLQEFERHQWHVSTGIFSTKMLFDVLRENNMAAAACRIAQQKDYPGWLYMLNSGATTLWEAWHAPGTVYSANHPMFGSIDEWFYRSLLGINAAAPGFKKIIIKPQPAGGIHWARGQYQSVMGNISSAWQMQNGQFALQVDIPVNSSATVYIPCAANAKITESGQAVTVQRYEDGYAIVELGSGNYQFIAQ
ncbi:MAG TPA: family 78 glycoside hydrolase catalytic domain [Chitinophagaceae bacterium]|nr:family 78 glycoside hydrolase catalytic domain [Chitinophagaceae bacterium]